MIIKQFKIGRYAVTLSWVEGRPGVLFLVLIAVCILGGITVYLRFPS